MIRLTVADLHKTACNYFLFTYLLVSHTIVRLEIVKYFMDAAGVFSIILLHLITF